MGFKKKRKEEALQFRKGSKERKARLQLLVNKGNHAHNCDVLEKGSGLLIPYKRPNVDVPYTEYLPCQYCLGYFMRGDLWKHEKSCTMISKKTKASGHIQSKSAMLLPVAKEASDGLKANVLSKMHADSIGLAVRNDALIVKFGARKYMRKGTDPFQCQFISQKMRELGRLLLVIREGDAIKSSDKHTEEAAEKFLQLCEMEYTDTVSANALTTLNDMKRNKPKLLPLVEDVSKLHLHLKAVALETKKKVKEAQVPDVKTWYELSQVTLAQLILFNRRRSGEMERMKLEDYQNASSELKEDIVNCLSPWEKNLCKKMKRVEIKGKRGRNVPVIIPGKLKEQLEELIAKREKVGVTSANPYVFACLKGSELPIRGSVALQKYADNCNLTQPELLSSTKLRKQIGTLSQVFNLQENEQDILAGFMGHDIRVHRQYYRLPEDTLQVAKVSKILLAMEKGNIEEFKGKSLEEITVDLDDISDDSASDKEDEDTTKGGGKNVGTSQSNNPDTDNAARLIFPEDKEDEDTTKE
ncbi:uncharacterized protein LOC144438066 [Glandiceps talaboti]